MAPPSAMDPQAVTDTQAAVVVGSLSVDGVPSRRMKAPKMASGIAPFANSDMFKGPVYGKPMAKRWDDLLSQESKARKPSSLKGAAKYLKNPGLISLGGGLPSSENFPIERVDIKIPQAPRFSEQDTSKFGTVASAGKYDIAEGKSLYDLHVALNYGQGTGSAQLLRFITEHTEIIHKPLYQDWQCCLTTGSTNALENAFRMLTERGDVILAGEYTFSTAVETAAPLAVRAIGIKMDSEGLLPNDMDHILSTWDPTERGAQKPRLLYTVPTGQNPTGASQGPQRRRDLYRCAQKHDIFILEDDPYYFLQMQPYTGPDAPDVPPPGSHAEFIGSLLPSFLSLDVDGRVLRLDTFAKTIAPGTRTGWIVGPEQLIERFTRHNEVSVQNPAGISQIILYKMLDETWGHGGFLDWLIHLRMQYTIRRDMLMLACERYLPKEVASWDAPLAGMFSWTKINHTLHPQAAQKTLPELEDDIFHASIDHGVLTSRGSWFRAEGDFGSELFFRTTFAAASAEQIDEAIKRFGDALRSAFGLK